MCLSVCMQLELADPVAVLREAAAEFVPLIPHQYRLAPDGGASSCTSDGGSSASVASDAASASQETSSDSTAIHRCQHRHSLERCC